MSALPPPLPVPALIWCPFPDVESARATARALVEAGLAACANIMSAMQSIYAWQGEVQEAAETGVLFKTNATVLPRCVAQLKDLHPYAEPAILAWECPASLPETIEWLAKLTG